MPVSSSWTTLADESQSSADKTEAEVLFDGSSLEGWQHKGNWEIEDGVITRRGKGGSLVYEKQSVPDDFELTFEWKVAEGSNSGVYYRPGQYEYQILDNGRHADGVGVRAGSVPVVRPHPVVVGGARRNAPVRDIVRQWSLGGMDERFAQERILDIGKGPQHANDFEHLDAIASQQGQKDFLHARQGYLV